ncbi:homeotic protein female sterile [Anopheles funestus]|uniref:homeotic protein female sterile n=1 Tax=Anopheles funestus TaxID=62324 RepID=UPI0020C647B6|nr:homeotic protein female sterile [Anopheles funestus]XP_049295823.1 homeotic protein female sterile [Anopheles funestus]XP_049295824.1 homeotic protein female sterile [Anopheles funestus]XP_049295825.1 homeotic protein female sterile [Anopheles funestus]
MLLTSLLSSACSLAVPSAAQKHFASGGDQHGTLPASTSSTTLASPSTATVPIVRPAHPAVAASLTLLHQHHHDRKQHGHRRPVDPAHGTTENGGEGAHPDLYNLTLTAMRQYLRNQLNASRLGKAPRKRSHVHVDAVDVEFYRRFKEFNTSQAVLDGVANHLATIVTNSSQFGQEASLVPTVKEVTDTMDPDEPLAIVTNVTPEPSPVTSSSTAPSAGTGQRDYSVLMDDPRGYITVSSSFPLRPGKSSTTWNTTFAQHRGYIYGLVSFSVICALVLGLFGVFRCLRATTTTRVTTEALTLPIQFIADDLAPLNANLNHLPVPMLSVQSPGCAGMERLGVPARGSIGSPPIRNERAGFHHQQQTQQQQSQQHQQQQQQQHPQQHQPSNQQNHHRHHHHQYHQQTSPTDQHLRFSSDLILSSSTSSNFRSSNHNQSYLLIPHQTNALGGSGGGGGSSGSNSINYKTHYSNSSYGGSSIGSTGTTNPITTNFPHCTYHVPLPDGEYGPDRDLQIRTPCQQSEIPRTYVKAPPNKTVRDVPVQYQSTGGITTHGTTMTAGIGTGHVNSMVDLASYYGGPKTIGRPADGGRLAATAPGPSLGGSGTCQQKSVDKLQKIFRFLPGKATKSSTPSSSSSSSASSASSSSSSSSTSSSSSSGIKSTSNINNNNNHQGACASYGGLQPPAPHPGVLPGSHSSSTGSLNNNNGGSNGGPIVGGGGAIASGSVISSISGSYGPNSVSNSIGCSNHVNNNRVGCGSSAGGNIRVDGRGGLSLATAGAGIHNHNQHYRSPPVAVSSLGSPSAATLSSPTASSSSSASSSTSSSSSSASSPSPLASTVARQSGVDAIVPGSSATGSVVSGSSSDPGHAPFTM